jgi:hypothetical protein
MKLLSAIGSVILFCVLAFLSLVLVWIFFFPAPEQGEAMGKAMAAVYLSPFAALGVIIGLVVYRLWKSRLFWMLWLVISAVAVLAGLMNDTTVRLGDVGSVLSVVFLLAPVFTVPLWQLVMAVSWGASTLRGRRTASSSTS